MTRFSNAIITQSLSGLDIDNLDIALLTYFRSRNSVSVISVADFDM